MRDKTLLWNGAHLAVLSAFALAQPLFNLLGDNPEFFAARGSTSFDIISFAVLLVVVPPALLLLIEFLLGLISETARDVAHLIFVGLGVALIVVQILNGMDASDAVVIGISVAIAAGVTVAYWKAEPVRSFLSVLSPAPLVFLVLFLFFSPVNELTLEGEASAQDVGGVKPVPVVMVLFDELPSTSLLDERRRIDADRYPAFARLAREGTWFRNAYSIYDSTSKAIPAIMDGNLPEEGTLPTSSDHPNSLFTLLANSHEMNVSEEATTVCPRDLCDDARLDESYGSRLGSLSEDLGLVWLHVVSPPDIEADLPSVSDTWGDFGGDQPAGGGAVEGDDDRPDTKDNLMGNRRAGFEGWIDSVRDTRRPALNFKHVLLPHVPWEYVPSGLQYRRTVNEAIPSLSNQSYEDQGQLDQLYLRHLLQLRFTDAELGKLLERLEDQGIYDEALIVVAADHGVAFDLGERDRRQANERNVHDISPVPLFIKAPRQKNGAIDDSYVETIDILPTIAEILGVEPTEEPDGRSVAERRRPQARRHADAQARPVRLHQARRRGVRAPQGRAARAQDRAVRHGLGGRRPHVPLRPQRRAGGPAGRGGRPGAPGRVARERGRLRGRGPQLRLPARPRARAGGRRARPGDRDRRERHDRRGLVHLHARH